ncbi:hypothetical protein K1W69_01645 [Hoeflea sp. WL0058]|uniref:Uncharacterized protein n=1 Tax=Flavimaribacter sediminis TaxID=2865987 RepID=A0AAE3CZN1_9HYPH|nr:hypothetical protein [Flavimaribacter sediminis]MBW8635871.1 hypothetical protein [Flavimaribacter sediminis]
MTVDKNNLFKPDRRSKAEATDHTARAIMVAEAKAREKKNKKLRAMRLEREAAEKAAEPDGKKRPASSRTKSRAAN